MDRKRKWDEPGSADGALGGAVEAGAHPDGDGPLKAVKTEPGATTRSASSEGGADKAAEAAAAIAARLASQYKGASGGGPPPPPGSAPPPPPPPGGSAPGHKGERDRDREAGLFVEDIEINDLRNRYLLTKGPTQQQILADTGANVLTRGVWYPDKSMATEKDPPLYLHITGDTEEKLAAGVKAVRALIDQDLNLLAGGPRGPGGPHGPGRQGDGPPGDRDSGYGQRRRWPEEKLPIELEPLRNFNVRAKVVGPGGMFVKWIQQETGTRVQIKGIGSGYIETDTNRESDEPMHINVAGPEPQNIERALELAKDLLAVIREKHAEALQAGPPQGQFHGGGGGGFQPSGANGYPGGGPPRYGGGAGMGMGGPGMDQQQQQSPYQYQANQYASPGLTAPLPPGEAPPAPPPSGDGSGGSAAPAGGAAASGMSNEQYMAWWNSLDAASQAYYTQYYAAYAQYAANPQAAQQPQQQQPPPPPPQQAAPPPPPGEAPPPPPPSDAPPPPPPPPPASNEPPQGGAGRYGAVPPPAGL
ncbi:hypothetical protein JCM3774_003810 [Rhodotorula dairenensis]